VLCCAHAQLLFSFFGWKGFCSCLLLSCDMPIMCLGQAMFWAPVACFVSALAMRHALVH
jgi:hypothetical protein